MCLGRDRDRPPQGGRPPRRPRTGDLPARHQAAYRLFCPGPQLSGQASLPNLGTTLACTIQWAGGSEEPKVLTLQEHWHSCLGQGCKPESLRSPWCRSGPGMQTPRKESSSPTYARGLRGTRGAAGWKSDVPRCLVSRTGAPQLQTMEPCRQAGPVSPGMVFLYQLGICASG